MPPHPLLLIFVHGLFGWGEDRDRARYPKDYWYGIRRFVDTECRSRPAYALKIVMPSLACVESIEVRGAALQRAIDGALVDCPPGTRAHLIAHSRGGLDARWVITQPGMADKIASLTTIGTAHRGTSFMTLAYRVLPFYYLIGKVLQKLETLRRHTVGASDGFYGQFLQGYDCSLTQLREALYPLTVSGAAEFNRRLNERECTIRSRSQLQVHYFAYGGAVDRPETSFLQLPAALTRWFGTRAERDSRNDGACSVWSAHYPWDDKGRDYVTTIPFDHYEQVNWQPSLHADSDSLPPHLQSLYRDIVQHILRLEPSTFGDQPAPSRAAPILPLQ